MAGTSPAMTLKFNALFVMPQMTRWKALLVGQRDELDLVSWHRAEMTGFPLRLCLLDAFLAG